MLELVFTVCMLSDAEHCERHSLLYVDLTPAQCVFRAQTVLAPWVAEHPGWRIDRYSCQYLDRRVTEL